MKAKDVMIPIHACLKPDSKLKEAVRLLTNANVLNGQHSGVTGLPVLDGRGNLVGMLSMSDILSAVFPFYMSRVDLGEFTWDGMLESLARQAGDHRVDSIMSRDVITVKEDDPIMECVDHILKHRIGRMPVLDKTGKVVGMVYIRDVFCAITKAMIEEECESL
jgi:CBS-domain-containing membrane protein